MKRRNEVLIGTIAEALEVGAWFNKFEFSRRTKITVECCNPRLRAMVNGKVKYLDSKPGRGRTLLYRMSAEQKELMLKKGREDKLSRGKARKDSKSVLKLLAKELNERNHNAWAFLKSVRFI